jgi:long-chain acyl-CoA synthetase
MREESDFNIGQHREKIMNLIEVRRLLKTLPNVKEEDLNRLSDRDFLMHSGIIDSLRLVEFVSAIEANFGLTLEPDELTAENFQSIETIGRLLDNKLTKVSSKPMSLMNLLHKVVLEDASRPAFTDLRTGDQYTYARLLERSGEIDFLLSQHGIGCGDRVALLSKNNIAFFPLLFGCAARKAALVPINPEWKSSEIDAAFSDSDPKLIVLDGVSEPQLRRNKTKCISLMELFSDTTAFEPTTWKFDLSDCKDEPILIIYTSGTTSHGKGVVLTQGNLCQSHAISSFYRFESRDRVLSFLPYYHMNAPVVTGTACIAAGAHVYLSELFGFTNAKFLWQLVEKYKISILSLTPSIMATLSRIFPRGPNADISSVRFGLVGTASLDAQLWKQFEGKFGFPCYQGYGLTETTMWATMTPPDYRKSYETVGIPVNCEIKIDRAFEGDVAASFATVRADITRDVGEVMIKGALVMQGYKDLKQTRQVMRDGWFRTGDLGYFDEDNQLVISGRIKNIVKRNGVLILPEEIDDVLSKHPAILEAKTVGLPDTISGEKLVSAIVCKDSNERENLLIQEYVRAEISSEKVPDEYVVLHRLPRNAVGKIDQKGLVAILTGDRCDQIVKALNGHEYRRAHSESMDEIKALVQSALLDGTPLRFVGHWGVGGRAAVNDADIATLDRLKTLIDSINELSRSNFAVLQLVLTDVHGKCNSIPEHLIEQYFNSVASEASQRNFKCVRSSEIWSMYGLDLAETLKETKTAAFLEFWESFELREDLIRQAGKRYFNPDPPENAAKRYYAVCMKERKPIAGYFKGSIFFTFSPPRSRPILPELPTVYWHSMKRGTSVKPWFVEDSSVVRYK